MASRGAGLPAADREFREYSVGSLRVTVGLDDDARQLLE